jgi:hypothetical protein
MGMSGGIKFVNKVLERDKLKKLRTPLFYKVYS